MTGRPAAARPRAPGRHRAAGEWEAFWFARVSGGPLGLFRIAFGLLVAVYGLLLFPDRAVWFSDRGVMTAATAAAFTARVTPGPHLYLLGAPTDRWLTAFFAAFLLAALLLSAGLWTRPAAVAVFLGLTALHNRAPLITNSGDTVMIVMAAYLVLAPAGAACSLDRLRRVLRGRRVARPRVTPWAQRLMQVQVSVIYLSTLLSKLSGSDWRDGTAVYYPPRLPDMARFPLPLLDADHLVLVNLLTYGTLLVEFSLAVLVWVPRLRLWALAGGVALHLGIEYGLNIPLFSALMIASYALFLTRADLEYVAARLRARLAPARLRLDVCDGPSRRPLVRAVHFFDVLGLVGVPADPPQTLPGGPAGLTAVDVRGGASADFAALRALAWRLPAFWALAPLLYLPGIYWLGGAAWAALAPLHPEAAPQDAGGFRWARLRSGKPPHPTELSPHGAGEEDLPKTTGEVAHEAPGPASR